jgi:hypothetical protein
MEGMTTYLATVITMPALESHHAPKNPSRYEREEIVLAFCGSLCREGSSYRDGWTGVYSAFDEYEFVEVCHYCGAPVASPLSVDEILAIEEEVERRVRPDLEPTPPLVL